MYIPFMFIYLIIRLRCNAHANMCYTKAKNSGERALLKRLQFIIYTAQAHVSIFMHICIRLNEEITLLKH